MTDLDRLLELRRIYRMTPKELDECKSLKAKIEGKIEKGDKFDVLNEVFEDYPKGWLDMKEDLESQVAKLQRDYSHLLRQKQDCETGKHNLSEIVSKIEAKAYMWDGHESMHYGNAIMKIIHPNWGDAQ